MSRFEEFLKTRRSPDTATNYRRCINAITKDPDSFLETAETSPSSAEKLLIEYFTTNHVSGAYQQMKLSALKSFLTFNDVELKWKKIASVLPVARKVAVDRAPSREEIAKMLQFCDLRTRMVVLCMAQAGFRLGAWKWLSVGDVTFLNGEISKIRIYRGEPEEYFTFAGPEATAAVREYLDVRKRAGEELGPASPLARDKWDFTDFRKKVDVRIVNRMKQNGLAMSIWRAWVRSGLRTRDSKWKPKEFKMAHGFRKFFKTNAPACKEHGNVDVEVLMGHYLSYYKPTEEHLLQYYRTAVPYLAIDERFRLKEEMERKEEVHESEWAKSRLESLELREELRRQKEGLAEERVSWQAELQEIRGMLETVVRERERELQSSGLAPPVPEGRRRAPHPRKDISR